MFIPRPTRGGLLFLCAAAAALGTAFMNVGLVSALIASVISAFVLSGFLLCWFTAAGFELRREIMQEGRCLEKVSLPVVVRNRTFLFRQPAVITEKLPFCAGGRGSWELPALAPHQTIRLEREVTAVRRGHFHLEKLQIVSGDPCGLFQVRKTFRIPGEMVIQPQIRPLHELPSGHGGQLSMTGDGRPLGHAGMGSDFFGVRPYRPGDEIRFVHWRLSAAKQKLMVREFEASAIDRIVLILDTDAASVGWDPAENNFEALVSLAASISEYFASQYCFLTLYTCFEGNLMQINGDAAGVHVKVMELLTELQPCRNKIENLVTDVLEFLPQNSVLYMLSMTASPALQGLLRILEEQNIQLQWVCAAREYFPIVSDEDPMEFVLPPEDRRFPQVFAPRLLTCQTRFEELFAYENAQV